MEEKNKSIDPLPDSFETEEEAGAFWDTHSTSDYEEYLEPVAELIEFFDTHDMGEYEEACRKCTLKSISRERLTLRLGHHLISR